MEYQITSFLRAIEVVGELEDQIDALDNQQKHDTDSPRCLPQIVVHQELLEKSSNFFRNALGGGMWKEAEENRVDLKASVAVLQHFANWLYCRDLSINLSWQLWI